MNEREKIIRLWFDMWIKKADLLLSMYIQKNEKQMVVDIKQSMLDLGYEEFPRNN